MAKIEFPRVLNIYETKEKAIIKLDTVHFSYGMPAVVRYKDSHTGSSRCIFAIGIDDGIGKYRIANDNENVSYYSCVRFREETDEEASEEEKEGKDLRLLAQEPRKIRGSGKRKGSKKSKEKRFKYFSSL